MGKVISIAPELAFRRRREILERIAASYEEHVWQRVIGLGKGNHGKASIGQDQSSLVPCGRPNLYRVGSEGAEGTGPRVRDTVHVVGQGSTETGGGETRTK
jgi:hypothetical protein